MTSTCVCLPCSSFLLQMHQKLLTAGGSDRSLQHCRTSNWISDNPRKGDNEVSKDGRVVWRSLCEMLRISYWQQLYSYTSFHDRLQIKTETKDTEIQNMLSCHLTMSLAFSLFQLIILKFKYCQNNLKTCEFKQKMYRKLFAPQGLWKEGKGKKQKERGKGKGRNRRGFFSRI